MESKWDSGEQGTPEVQSANQKKLRIGEIALEYGLITEEQLDIALTECKKAGRRLGETLVNLRFVTEGQLNWALSHHFNIPLVEDLNIATLDLDLIRSIPQEFLFAHTVLPLAILDDEIAVAMTDPTDSETVTDLESITGRKVRPSIASARHISQALSDIFASSEGSYQLETDESLSAKEISLTLIDPVREENFSGSSFLNFHLTEAILQDADEIHIDPLGTALWVRYRVGGILKHKSMESMAFYEPLGRQLRIIGKLGTQKTTLQKAELKVRLKDRDLRLRVCIYPTLRGDATWIKILKEPLDAEESQLSQIIASVLEKFSSHSHGLFLVTSSFLSERVFILSELIKQLDSPQRKIIVLERRPSLPLSRSVHLTLDHLWDVSDQGILEELLNQNPEVLVLNQLGTFSDLLTPALWEAASSSTLVIGSLADKDSGEALQDLLQKTNPITLRSILRYLIAGTKFKKLCPACQELYTPSPETLTRLNLAEDINLYRSVGCERCAFMGVDGELRLYELLEIDQETQAILQNTSPDKIREVVLKRMENSIQRQALQKLKEGILSVEEVMIKVFN